RSLGRPTGGIIATALAPRSRSARSDTSNAFVAEQRADRHVGPSGDGPRGPGERLGSEPVGGAGSDVGAERGRQDRAAVRGRSGGTTRAPPRSDVASGSQRPLARRSRPRAVADRPALGRSRSVPRAPGGRRGETSSSRGGRRDDPPRYRAPAGPAAPV